MPHPSLVHHLHAEIPAASGDSTNAVRCATRWCTPTAVQPALSLIGEPADAVPTNCGTVPSRTPGRLSLFLHNGAPCYARYPRRGSHAGPPLADFQTPPGPVRRDRRPRPQAMSLAALKFRMRASSAPKRRRREQRRIQSAQDGLVHSTDKPEHGGARAAPYGCHVTAGHPHRGIGRRPRRHRARRAPQRPPTGASGPQCSSPNSTSPRAGLRPIARARLRRRTHHRRRRSRHRRLPAPPRTQPLTTSAESIVRRPETRSTSRM